MGNITLFTRGGNTVCLLLLAGVAAICSITRSQGLFTNDARNLSAGGFGTASPSPWGIAAASPADSTTTFELMCAAIPSPFGIPALRTMTAAATVQWQRIGVGVGASQSGTTVVRDLIVRSGLAVAVDADLTCSVAFVWRRMTFERYGSASTWTIDAGLRQRFAGNIQMQALLVNIAGRIGGFEIDVASRQHLGGGWNPWDDLRVVFEVEHEQPHPLTLRGGIEWTPIKGVTVRAGASERPALYAGGLTINAYGVEFTLASVLHEPLGWTQVVECGVHLGGGE